MANQRDDREMRWENSRIWLNRDEAEDREGDRSKARDYDENDQRRYARRSVNLGNRLRQTRGEGNAPEGETGRESWDRNTEFDSHPGWQEIDRDALARRRAEQGSGRDWTNEEAEQRRQRGYEASGNYYGERRRREAYGGQHQSDGFISARGQRRRDQNEGDWESDAVYDVNPGFSDEFGTERTTYGIADPEGDWDTPGPFTGMGPQGYQRSDERIRDDVYMALTRHPHVDAREIEIDVQNGEVILGGKARSKNEKRLAEDVAAAVHGVKDVTNQIKTNP